MNHIQETIKELEKHLYDARVNVTALERVIVILKEMDDKEPDGADCSLVVEDKKQKQIGTCDTAELAVAARTEYLGKHEESKGLREPSRPQDDLNEPVVAVESLDEVVSDKELVVTQQECVEPSGGFPAVGPEQPTHNAAGRRIAFTVKAKGFEQ